MRVLKQLYFFFNTIIYVQNPIYRNCAFSKLKLLKKFFAFPFVFTFIRNFIIRGFVTIPHNIFLWHLHSWDFHNKQQKRLRTIFSLFLCHEQVRIGKILKLKWTSGHSLNRAIKRATPAQRNKAENEFES